MQINSIKHQDSSTKAVAQITTYLKGQGYLVQADVKVRGKSGISQNFDLLAKRDDGFTTRTIAIKLLRGSNQEIESGAIFDFSNKAFAVCSGLSSSFSLISSHTRSNGSFLVRQSLGLLVLSFFFVCR